VIRVSLVLAAMSFAPAHASVDVDPEPAPDRAKSLEKIARSMDDLAKRMKDGLVDDETHKLHERVTARLGEALKRETARNVSKGQVDLAPGLERVRIIQERVGQYLDRVGQFSGKKRDAVLAEMGAYQAKAAQMLRDAAAHCKPVR
jgi:hypothetical protein